MRDGNCLFTLPLSMRGKIEWKIEVRMKFRNLGNCYKFEMEIEIEK